MSAIGSVIVMAEKGPFPPWFRTELCSGRPSAISSCPNLGSRPGRLHEAQPDPGRGFPEAEPPGVLGLPGALGDAGKLAPVAHLTQADTAEAELAVDGVRPPAPLAAGVRPHLELRLARRLDDQCLLRHVTAP